MRSLTLLSLIQLLSACAVPVAIRDVEGVRAAGHQLAYERSDRLVVEPDAKGGYRLLQEVEVSITFLAERSVESLSQFVYEPYWAPIEGLEAFVDDERLGKSHITRIVPERHDVFLDDAAYYRIQPTSLRPGQRLSYRYRQRYQDLTHVPLIIVPNLDWVVHRELTVDHPTDVQVDFSLSTFSPIQSPRITRSATRSMIRFARLDQREVRPREAWPDLQLAVLPVLRKAGRVLSPVTPEEFARWYFGELKGVNAAVDLRDLGQSGLRAKTAASPRQQLRQLYDFVRREIRYIADERGINGYVPRPAAFVLKQRYGDCKDKANLLVRLAAQLGLHLDLMLVGTQPRAELEPGLVHQFLYDHMVAVFRDGAQLLVLDPTCEDCELGDLPEMDVESQALLLTRGAARALRIAAPPHGAELEAELTAAVDDLRGGRARVRVRHDLVRKLIYRERHYDAARFAEDLSRILGEKLPTLLFKNVRVDERRTGEWLLSAQVDLSRFVVRSQGRVYVPRAPFAADAAVLERIGDARPIFVNERRHQVLRLDLKAPGFSAAAAAAQLGASSVAEFDSKLEVAPDLFRFVFRRREHRRWLVGEARAQYLEFCRRYLDLRSATYVLSRSN